MNYTKTCCCSLADPVADTAGFDDAAADPVAVVKAAEPLSTSKSGGSRISGATGLIEPALTS